MRSATIVTLTLVAALAAATKGVAQAPYALDTTYRTEFVSENVNSIALLASGKILASGRIRYASDPWATYRGSTRMNTDGSRDLVFTAFTGGGRIVPWSNKFYVSAGAVRRLDGNGVVDPSFIQPNTDPYMNYSGSGSDYHVYPDGRVLVDGSITLIDTIRGHVGSYDLVWLSNTGYYDTTRTPRRCEPGRAMFRMMELTNGQFICSSNCTQYEGKAVDWIFRFNADGTPDTTFRTGVNGGGAYTFLPLSDGRVYAGGSFRRSSAPQDTLRLVRFTQSGSLDSTFAIPAFSDGTLNGPFVGPLVTSLTALTADRFIATGNFRYVNGEPRHGICILDSSGTLMPEFAACGVDSIYFNPLWKCSIDGLVIDSLNGYMYICGSYAGYTDSTLTDTTQRFVSRLFLGNIATSVAERFVNVLLAYPNPSSGLFTLALTLPATVALAGDLTLQVFDAQGRLVERRNLGRQLEQRIALDLTAQPTGLYSAHLSDGKRILTGVRLVVE